MTASQFALTEESARVLFDPGAAQWTGHSASQRNLGVSGAWLGQLP